MTYAESKRIIAGGTGVNGTSVRQGKTVLTLESAPLSELLIRSIGILRKYEDALGRFDINGAEVRYEVNDCFGLDELEKDGGVRRFLTELPLYVCDSVSLEIQNDSDTELAMFDCFEKELSSFARKAEHDPCHILSSLSLARVPESDGEAEEVPFYSRTYSRA